MMAGMTGDMEPEMASRIPLPIREAMFPPLGAAGAGPLFSSEKPPCRITSL